jgi:hypothetical protein
LQGLGMRKQGRAVGSMCCGVSSWQPLSQSQDTGLLGWLAGCGMQVVGADCGTFWESTIWVCEGLLGEQCHEQYQVARFLHPHAPYNDGGVKQCTVDPMTIYCYADYGIRHMTT